MQANVTHPTNTERKDFIALLLRLHHKGLLVQSTQQRRLVADYLISAFATNPALLYNEFGINRMVLAFKTIELATEGIGLNGNILLAYLLRTVITHKEQCTMLEHFFDTEISNTVQAFLRVDSIEAKDETMRSDNFRNLLISQAGDMRVLLMLIADNLCLMRHIKNVDNVDAQQLVSHKAAWIYAPLAHKLGLYKLKSELEDLSLKYLEHDAYYHIKECLNATKRTRDAYIVRFIEPICHMLDSEGLRYQIKGRTKSIHSIWQKMKKQRCSFEGVYDLFAIRIIIDSPYEKEKEQCWKAFSLITNKYESNLKRLRDWLTVPKSNGYESLHITVKGPEEKWVEVQIRTERMDEIAEHGLAAHWRYKGVKSTNGNVDSWLSDIRSALETGDEKLLGNSLSTELKESDIYVFSPKGDLLRLPPHSTILDFAYYIHTQVGNHCVGGCIEGRNYSLRHELKGGQTVEILTANNQHPKTEWLNIARSSHARAKIRSSIRELTAADSMLGKELLERRLKNRKIEWDEGLINQLIKKMGYKESYDFFGDLNDERIDINEVLDIYQELERREQGLGERAEVRSAEEFNFDSEACKKAKGVHDELVIGSNLKGVDYQLARCCNPGYGDNIFGFVTVNGGIKIHRENCPNAPALRERFGYRILKARWAGKGDEMYPITLNIVGHDNVGIVNNITSIIAKEPQVVLRNIHINSTDSLFSGILTVFIDDTTRLNSLIKKLQGVKGVKAISRY